ncbi:hypothetical protein M407DRAFT_243011 [Tulasnella calospora MUT 4182]|uniref:HD domain-containing protein n=1 Tax=Tulasnella calospora MUT 4182 TaxID=1051891 RepID=A0A0C3QCL3_9AGAM|nr:hypothetical protein M407DRAFT_243011 [Tulasnella calospora MUT 4182]
MNNFNAKILTFLNELDPRKEGSTGALSAKWSERIVASYTEDHRFYHTLAHLEVMWANLGIGKEEADWWSSDQELVLKLAILFHDIIYDPRANDNEEKSNELFIAFAQDANLTSSITHAVSQTILATIKHRLPDAPYTPCLPFFLDLDLEVLSRPRSSYGAYATAIRQEYIHVPEPDFRVGRTAVLQNLGAGDIYFTEVCKKLWTQEAKDNIAREIAELCT